MEGYWKFQDGGVSKAKVFKGKYEANLEFPEGWRSKPKTLLCKGYGYFLKQHNGQTSHCTARDYLW